MSWEVLEFVGSDGFVEMYRVLFEGRARVLKRIRPDLVEDPTFRMRLGDEARLTSRFDHPNLLRTVAAGIDDDEPWLLVEEVEGKTLAATLAAGRMPATLAAWVVSNVLRGLDYAHHATDPSGRPLGIVHRDVCPSTVLVGWNGAVKLEGFALARWAARAAWTDPGVIVGRLAYLSPEQVHAAPVDGRSDVFACGTLLHEMIAGRNPWRAKSDLATIDAIRRAHMPPLEDAPAALEEVVRRALAADPADRWPTAAAFADALDDLCRKSEPPPTPRTLTQHLRGLFDPERA